MTPASLRLGLALVLAVPLVGCSSDDDGAPAVDASADAGASNDDAAISTTPEPPVIPWWDPATRTASLDVATPAFTCAPGWRPIEVAGVTACDPWPETGPASCAADEAHFPGEPGCVRVGTECPAGPFPEGLPADQPIVYVLAGAPSGAGTGTLDNPYATITEALSVAPASAIIAIGKGTYDERPLIRASQTLWGACTRETVLMSSVALDPSAPAGVVAITGAGRLRNLSIGASRTYGAAAGDGGSLVLEDVVVDGTTLFGVVAALDGTLSIRGSVIRNVAPYSGNGRAIEVQTGVAHLERVVVEGSAEAGILVGEAGTLVGRSVALLRGTTARRGLQVQRGASAQLRDVAIEYGAEAAVFVNGSTARLENAVLADAVASARGVEVRAGGSIELVATRIAGALGLGAVVSDVGSSLGLSDVVVTGTRTSPISDGSAIEARDGAIITGSRVIVDSTAASGVTASGTSATVTLDDVIIRDGVVVDRTRPGIAAIVGPDGEIALRRALVVRNGMAALVASDGGLLRLEDVLVRETNLENRDGYGFGVTAQRGGRVEASRLVLIDNATASLAVRDADALVDDLVIASTRATAAGLYGFGLSVGGGTLRGARHAVFDSSSVGILINQETSSVELSDLRVERVTSAIGLGYGMIVESGARTTLERAYVADTRGAGVLVNYGGALVARGLTVDGVARPPCPSICVEGPEGVGVAAFSGALVDLTDFTITRGAVCGLYVGLDSMLDAARGEVSQCEIGACIAPEGYDTARISTDVRYHDNRANLQATVLPVPAPIGVPGENI